MAKTVIENGTVLTVDEKNTIHKTGYVVVENDRITAVGAGKPDARLRDGAERIIDAGLKAVMPGMVNAHTHLFQSFIRGLADDKPLLKWLETAIWPVAAVMDGENAEMAARLGLIENIRGGATSVIDHQYVHTEPAVDDGVFRAALDTGVRFRHAFGWADMNYHPSLQLKADYVISEMERLHAAWQGKGNGRLSFEPAPVIPWGCTDDSMRRNWELVKKWGSGMQIHVAETQEEIDMNLKDRGNRHIEWLKELGMLGPEVQLVHSVWLADNELELVRESGACVVHCPVSNMYLASGAARIPEMKRMGIHVALASDGPGSNNNQDMMEVLKTTALLAKLSTLDAMALMPDDVIRFATMGGAHAMGIPAEIGSLEVGKKADIILIDLDSPFAMPVHRANSAIVYNLGSAAVDTVMVDGEILLEEKEFTKIDEKKLLADARQSCGKLFGRAGVVL